MNRSTFIAIIVAIAATAVSCQKSELDDNQVPISVSFGIEDNAVSKDALSKTFLNASGVQKYGSGYKYLYAYDVDNNSHQLKSTDTGTNALTKTFQGNMDKGKAAIFFYYPGSSSTWPTLENGVFTVVGKNKIPNEQNANTNNSFHVGWNPLVAKPSDSSLRNIMGYFKWQALRVDGGSSCAIKSVRFDALTSGEYLTGEYLVDYNGDTPIATCKQDGDISSYVVSTPNTKNVEVYTTYAIVFPRTYHGIKMTVTLNDGNDTELVFQDTQDIVVNRGEAIPFGYLPTAPIPTE